MFKIQKTGGMSVKRGNYWNFSSGERVQLKAAGTLPGDPSTTYYPVHPIALLLMGPVLGLVYAIFLPFIGIAMLLSVVGKKLVASIAHEFQKVVVFSWNPVEAYLTGKKEKDIQKQGPEDPKKE